MRIIDKGGGWQGILCQVYVRLLVPCPVSEHVLKWRRQDTEL